MGENQVEEVKAKTDIVSVIGEHVELKKAGTNYKGLCPFHGEKTPSFIVSPSLQIYKCFGCDEGGDVFSFLQKLEGMDFGEALKYLADRANVKLKSFTPIDNSKENLYKANDLAAKFYHYLLTSHNVGKGALDYVLNKRKISKESIETFNIGFAPDKPDPLFNYLTKKKKMNIKDILNSGLVLSIRGKYIDRFRGRIIFPISDHRGNFIALAGRLLPPEHPNVGKYINSPETPIYHKSSNLYGLNITREFIKKEGKVVVVEGELDLISGFQAGVKNVVAIKGSTLTADQARLISRWTKEIILALDSDFAGSHAALRGIEILEREDLEVKVAKLGKFKDPDEIAHNAPDKYKSAIEKAESIWDFIIESYTKDIDTSSGSAKRKVSRELVPIIAKITDKIVQAHYIGKLARILEVPITAVEDEVAKFSGEIKEDKEEVKGKNEIKGRRGLIEERLVGLLFSFDLDSFKKDELRNVFKTRIATRIYSHFQGSSDVKSLPAELKDNLASNSLLGEDDPIKLKQEINLLYKELLLLDAKEKISKSAKNISKLEGGDNEMKLQEAKESFSNLTHYLEGLEKEKFRGII